MSHKTSKVILEGRGALTIRPNDHIATGGEGSAYRLNDTVIKLYTDPSRMKENDMVGKIKYLSNINHKSIVAPQGLVTDTKGEPLGFYMPYVSGEPITRIFTNDFRARMNFNDNKSSKVSELIRESMIYAHSKKAIMVDANEMNWLIDLSNNMQPYAIDVDSWMVGKWKATAIMPSIRDWSNSDFNELTDWFAWGIVTFQIYTGIHPYKGTMPNFKRGDLEGRMQANASVFDSEIRLNSAVRDFSCIPSDLAQWYEAVFQNGERSMPPSPLASPVVAKAARTMRKVISSSTDLTYQKIYSKPNDAVVRIFPCGAALFKSGSLVDIAGKREITNKTELDCEVIRVDNGWLIAAIENNETKYTFVHAVSYEKEDIKTTLNRATIFRYMNRLFSINEAGLSEVTMTRLGKPSVAIKQTWKVMAGSTSWFDGLGVMDSIGAKYLVLPFSDDSCAHMRVKELDGMKIMNAVAGHRFATVIVADNFGKLHKQEYWFNKNYTDYSFYSSNVDTSELNIAILEKGVCASIIEDGELIIFVPSNGNVKKIQDKNIHASMKLQAHNDRVLLSDNDAIWLIKAN